MEGNQNDGPVQGIEELKLKSVDSNSARPHQHLKNDTKSHNGILNCNEKMLMSQPNANPQQKLPPRTESPRRVQDIHLDGTVDDMQNVDPYLLDEKDLDIQSEPGGRTGTMSSNVSVNSWRSFHLSKSKEAQSPRVGRSIDRPNSSRARALKQHEHSPFLSIDVTPENNSARSISHRVKTKSPLYGSQHSLLSMSTAGLNTQRSARSSMTDRPSSSRSQGGIKLFTTSSLVAPKNVPVHANHNIKKPFKHDVRQVELTTAPLNPSLDLKDRTALATHAINKILRSQTPSKTRYIQGRLLKARLKPLEPVDVSEPTIQQCRGIVSETRKYTQCDSRTLQRWRAIMSGGQIASHQDALREGGASTSESIHRTSEASTPDLTLANVDDLDTNMLEENAWLDELNNLMNEDRESIDGREKVPPLASIPNSREGPVHCGEELSIIQGPDFDNMNGRPPSTVVTERENTVDSLVPELKTMTDSNEKRGRNCPQKEASSESVISVTTDDESKGKFSTDTSFDKISHIAYGPTSKRPHSATFPQESVVPRTSSILRPKTAMDTSHKAVRFADHDDTSDSLLKNAPPGKGINKDAVKTRGSKGKSSCRPFSSDSGFDDKDDDDPGDENGRGKGVRTFLTQEPSKASSNSGESMASQTTKNSSQGERKSKKSNANGKYESCYENTLKLANALSSKNSSSKTLNSSQKVPDYEDPNDSLSFIHHKINNMNEKPVTASIIYTDNENENSRSVKATSSIKPKKLREMQNNAKQPILKKEEGENINSRPTSKENAKTSEIETSPGESCQATDINILQQATEEKHSSFRTDQRMNNLACQQNHHHDYDKYSRVQPPKRTVSSAKRAKAYQNLVRRMSKNSNSPGNNAFMDDSKRRPSGKPRATDRRPSSGSCFSEKSKIQSKHGLLNVKTRPSSTLAATQRDVKSATDVMTKKQKSKPDGRNLREGGSSGGQDENAVGDYDEKNVERKLRPKSASKVTFADEKAFEKNDSKQDYSHSLLKLSNRNQTSIFGSSDSLQTQHTDNGIFGADFNRMWEEIPTDDSEDDIDENRRVAIDVEEEDLGLMTKFNDLETQFELLRSEMAEEKSKLNILDSEGKSPLTNEMKGADNDYIISTCSDILSVEDENDSKNPDEENETESPGSIFVTSEQHLQVSDDTSSSSAPAPSDPNDKQGISSSLIPEGDDESAQTTGVVISSNLYKKTHLYVEISKSFSSSSSPSSPPHKNKSHSQQMPSSHKKTKALKCVPIEEAELPHAEERPSTDSHLLDVNNCENGEKQSQFQKESTDTTSTTTVAPSLYVLPTNQNGDKSCIENELSSRKKSTVSIKSEKTRAECVKNKSQNSSSPGSKKVDDLSPISNSKKNNNKVKPQPKPGVRLAPKASEYTHYSDILLAYRQHCMQDSEYEDREQEDEVVETADFESLQDLKSDSENNNEPADSDKAAISSSDQQKSCQWNENNESVGCNGHKIMQQNTDSIKEMTAGERCEKDSIETQRTEHNNKVKPNNLKAGCDSGVSKNQQRGNEPPFEFGGSRPGSADKNNTKGKYSTRSSSPNACTLEIVAKSKVLSKSSKQSPLADVNMAALCKLPPLCFQLNARPPSGFFYYFAYDQNMNPHRLATYLNAEKPPPRFWALLFGFRLAFTMKIPEFDGAGGQPNLEYDPKSSVEGCVYQMTVQQLASLDIFMGYPQHYEHVVLPVWMTNCPDSDDQQLGVSQYCVPALTFIAHDACTWHGPSTPNSYAVEQCVKSADIVSPQYKEHLQTFLPLETSMALAIKAA